MTNLLEGIIPDPGALYAANILGFNGQNCQFDGTNLTNSCMFQSSFEYITLENWDSYFVCDLDLGVAKEGILNHPQLGEVYIKPNPYISENSQKDIWINFKSKQVASSEFVGGQLGWFNFNIENVIGHPVLQNINSSSRAMLGQFQENLAVFMFSNTTNFYHCFICNENKQIFVSESLEGLDNISYYINQPAGFQFFPLFEIGDFPPEWSLSEEEVYVPEGIASVYKKSFIIKGSVPIAYNILDYGNGDQFTVDEFGSLEFINTPSFEEGQLNQYLVKIRAENNFGYSDLSLTVIVEFVPPPLPLWSDQEEDIYLNDGEVDININSSLIQGNQGVTYSIDLTAQDVKDKININENTGVMSFKSPPGINDSAYYEIILTATNSSGSDNVVINVFIVRPFIALNKTELLVAVDEWINNKEVAKFLYQDIHLWDVSQVTDMSWLFLNKNFNDDISSWNVSNVTNMSNMFEGSSFNQSIENWNVSNVTDMSSMFLGSSFNQSIENWNVSNVTDMSSMFLGSSFNQSIENWNVSNVTDMSSMFLGSSFNQSIANWNVSNVTNMSNMFEGSSFNQSIANWNVSNVTNMSSMFERSSFNQSIENWNVSNVTNMSSMFERSSFNQFIANWNVSKVTNMSSMFERSSFNQSIANWNVSNVTNMSRMFLRNTAFNQSIGNWNTGSLVDLTEMFRYASGFNNGYTAGSPSPSLAWNVAGITDMGYLFSEAGSFNGDLSSWNLSSVTNIEYMFSECVNFNRSLNGWGSTTSNITNMKGVFYKAYNFNGYISNWDTSNVTDMSYMFYHTVFNQPIGNWNTGSVRYMNNMFEWPSGRPPGVSYSVTAFNQPIGGWDTSNVVSMERMFYNNGVFNQSIGNWHTGRVVVMRGMFARARKFNQAIGGWDVSSVTDMSSMFDNSSFNQSIANWNVSNVTNMYRMFSSARSFNQPVGNWNTSKVLNMSMMFLDAESFNQPIGQWNTSSVQNTASMFWGASAFNQPFEGWDLSNVIQMQLMFSEAISFDQDISGFIISSNLTRADRMFLNGKELVNGVFTQKQMSFSTNNYDKLLNAWSNLPDIPKDITFGAGTTKYSSASRVSREKLVNEYGWYIADGGQL
jgi:surface protein